MKILLNNILAFATLFSAILVITTKNPIISVIFLIFVFSCAALWLITVGISFIGISYIIVYIGAIAVIFLFIVMMINIKLTDVVESGSDYTKNLPLAFLVGTLFIYTIFSIVPFTFNNVPALDFSGSFLSNIIASLNSLFISDSSISSKIIENTLLITHNPVIADTTFTNYLQVQGVGHSLFTYSAILLMILSVILLLSMVAPIFFSKKI